MEETIKTESIDYPCGYFEDRICNSENIDAWRNNLSENDFIKLYSKLIQKGYRRSCTTMYTTNCKNCKQCIPIRLKVKDFLPSKSQRHSLKKNEDVEITYSSKFEDFITEEKAALFAEYDYYHNHGKEKKLTVEAAKERLELMHLYPFCLNFDYRVNGKLIAVGIVDMTLNDECTPEGFSSNYFYYDVSDDVRKRSPGVFSVMYEIQFCQEHDIPYYYLGLYLPDCRKMNYKINYKPYELYINGEWILMPEETDKIINPNKLSVFQEPGSFPIDDAICAVSEDISLQDLYSAYMQGIFPWFNEDDGMPVLWQSPAERYVIIPEEMHVPESVKKFLKKNPYTYTMDKCFNEVIQKCREQERPDQNGTWIGKKIISAYCDFHRAGYAHSIEVWHDGKLAGGFYGVLIGKVFFGESMFTIEPNSSKSAFCLFAECFKKIGGQLIDCQCYTDNMARYHGKNISRNEFLLLEKQLLHKKLDEDLKTAFEEFANRK